MRNVYKRITLTPEETSVLIQLVGNAVVSCDDDTSNGYDRSAEKAELEYLLSRLEK